MFPTMVGRPRGGSFGRRDGAVTVPLLVPTDGPYVVRVSASAADRERIVARGNRAAPSL
jgi:hypothetical protein